MEAMLLAAMLMELQNPIAPIDRQLPHEEVRQAQRARDAQRASQNKPQWQKHQKPQKIKRYGQPFPGKVRRSR